MIDSPEPETMSDDILLLAKEWTDYLKDKHSLNVTITSDDVSWMMILHWRIMGRRASNGPPSPPKK